MKLTSLVLALGALSTAAFGQSAATASPRLVCLLLDLHSMSAADQAKAQDRAIQFVEQDGVPTDLVQIVTYTSQLNVLQDFTANPDSLLAAIRGVVPGQTAGTDDMSGRLQAIQAAAASLAQYPERKTLVYFATPQARPSSPDDQSQLDATIDAAMRSNLLVYAIDLSQNQQ